MDACTAIISTEELAAILTEPELILVDCRFDLNDPAWGSFEYEQLHIPGAVYADLDKDLSGEKTSKTGRHPLPSPDDLLKTFSKFGISNNSQVVAYDATGGSFAARLWFMLNLYGHTRVAILDGGFSKWHMEGRTIEEGRNENTPGSFSGKPDTQMVITTGEMEKIHADPSWRVIDARSAERYAGENEPIDPVAGHIPFAVDRFHGLNLASSGVFKPADQLRSEFSALIENIDPQKVVAYCGSGVTSCHHLVAMKIAGITPAKLYAGSWSEWIRDPDHPVNKSNTP